ncbi:MAG: DUF58 domain-containing protein [Deltaproteobacteria bacterium]|jgi:uncharacterized protein (DUF58 family)|nr:DUF58 domain-containing protein [Deltaproteobacteria bacterium]
MLLPTQRTGIIAAATIPISGIILTAFPESLQSVGYFPLIALVLFLGDLFLSPSLKTLQVDFTLPPTFLVGVTHNLEISFTLPQENLKPLKLKIILETRGNLTSLPLETEIVAGSASLTLPLEPTRRGQATLEALWLSLTGPLKFLEARKKIPIHQTLEIIQNISRLHEEALTYLNKDLTIGQKTQPYKGQGAEFENLTDYSVGMDNRFIDWKHSARHHKLLAKEFRIERNHQIILGFDTGRLLSEYFDAAPRLDHFVRAGLTLGWVSLKSGDLVGACGFARFFHHYLAPGGTPSFFVKLQKFTQGLDYLPEETNFTLCLTALSTRLKQRALIVLFTEFSDTVAASLLVECLELLTRRHVVIFVSMPDPLLANLSLATPNSFQSMAEAVIAEELRKERAIVLERMSRLGVHCLDVPKEKLGASLLNRYILIKDQGLL